MSPILYTVCCGSNTSPEPSCGLQLCPSELLGPDLGSSTSSFVTRASSEVSMAVVSRHRTRQSTHTERSGGRLWSRCSRDTLQFMLHSVDGAHLHSPVVRYSAILYSLWTLWDNLGQHGTDYRCPSAQGMRLNGPKLQSIHEHCPDRYRMVHFTGTSYQYMQTLAERISTKMDNVDTIYRPPTDLYKARSEDKTMSFPSSGHPPQLRYDDRGNPHVLDMHGQWIPCNFGTTIQPNAHGPLNIREPASTLQQIPGHDTGYNMAPRRDESRLMAPPQRFGDGRNDDYKFTFRSVDHAHQGSAVASSSRRPILDRDIDPTLIPLPISDDRNLSDPRAIAKARGYSPTEKVAGSRKKKGGRPQGAGNYLPNDIKALLSFTRDELPIGQRGWAAVHTQYAHWSRKHKRPSRTQKSLETKFKAIVKTTKPTGDGVLPPEVAIARDIDASITERAGTRDLNDSDSDFDGSDVHSHVSISSDEEPPRKKVAIARHVAPDVPIARRNARGANGLEMISKLSQAFDPEVQKLRDQDRSDRTLQNTQFLALNQQLRDATANNEALRTQLSIVQNHAHTSERARDRAEMKLEMLTMSTPTAASTLRGRPVQPAASRRKEKGKRRSSAHFADGGSRLQWLTDDSDDVDSDGHRIERNPNGTPSNNGYWNQPPSLSKVRRDSTRYQPSSRYDSPPFTQHPSNAPKLESSSPPPITALTFHRSGPAATAIPSGSVHQEAVVKVEDNAGGRTPPSFQLSNTPLSSQAFELTISPRRGRDIAFIIKPEAEDIQVKSENTATW